MCKNKTIRGTTQPEYFLRIGKKKERSAHKTEMNTETIAAIATPMGSGGIGIIKMSGNDAISIASSIFQFSGDPSSTDDSVHSKKIPDTGSRKIFFGRIINPHTRKAIDEVLLMVMPGPRSYTREDVVEIHTHGGVTVLEAILVLIFEKGARPADPGEFTKRAFLNGRIDLTQAEAVMDLINARSEMALNMAANQVSGVLAETVEKILENCLDLLAEGEAAIDFPEDVGEIFQKDAVVRKLKQHVLAPLDQLITQCSKAQLLRQGIKAVIVGRPNVGKSSLMNCLLEKERVIVSDIPGTTRDFIEESRLIRNLQIIFTDTAGLHKSNDAIENIGIQKTYEYIDEADIVLFVVDLKNGIGLADLEIVKSIEHKKILMVLNKVDLVEEGHEPELYEEMLELPKVRVSAKYRIGQNALENEIMKLAVYDEDEGREGYSVMPNLRHHKALKSAKEGIEQTISAINHGISPELCVIDLKSAIHALEEIIGKTVTTDVLDKIFEQFCIGK